MTLDEICTQLGLENPREFDGFDSAKKHHTHFPRASERTTRMLLDVMMCIQKGDPAIIVAANYDHKQWLQRNVNEWCQQLQFDRNLVTIVTNTEGPDYHRARYGEWFYDHWTIEKHQM